MTIRILKTEPFYPLGKPLPRPATDLVKKVDELIRPGVFRKADGTFETRGYEPPAEPSKPAAPKYRCDTCEDTGKCHGPIPVNGGYREGEIDCPDCEGEEPPAAALGDGWIEWHGGACPVEPGTKIEVRLRYAEHCSMRLTPDFTQPVAAGFWLNDGMGNDIVAYHLLPKGGAA